MPPSIKWLYAFDRLQIGHEWDINGQFESENEKPNLFQEVYFRISSSARGMK